jgi:hypothetical protein
LKILVVTPFENRMAARGTRLPVLADMLSARGHDVEYVTTNFSHAYKTFFSEDEIEEYRSKVPYRVSIIPTIGYRANISIRRVISNICMSVLIFRYLLRIVAPGDIIVTPSRPVDMVAMISLLKIFRDVHIVLDIRDIWPDALEGVSPLKKRLFSIFCNLLLGPSLKRIDRFVHIAPSFVQWLNRYAPMATSRFIPAGFDGSRWKASNAKKSFIGPHISFVFVGVLQLQLDIMPFLVAIVDRPHSKLTLIGDDGTGQRYPEVIDFIHNNKMWNVKVLGRMPPQDVVAQLAYHDIGIVPMITSSIPNKVFDYIASYLPIFSLGESDCSDFVEAHDIGWTAPFDPQAIARTVDGIGPDDINRKIHNLKGIRHLYDRDRLFQDFIQTIEELD